MERVTELDPRDADLFADLGAHTYGVTRRYPDAIQALDRALALAPDFHGAAVRKGWTHVAWQGELGTLRTALDAIPGDTDLGLGWLGSTAAQGPVLARDRAWILAQAGEAEAALDEIERLVADPSWLSVPILRLDPRWDPIREHPHFEPLLAKYAVS